MTLSAEVKVVVSIYSLIQWGFSEDMFPTWLSAIPYKGGAYSVNK